MKLKTQHSRKINNLAPVLAATAARGSSEKLLASNGELNAGSKQELVGRILELASRLDATEFEAAAAEVATPEERREIVTAAYYDPTGKGMAELGSQIAGTIYESVQRQGFARRILTRGDLQLGSIPRIRARIRNVEAVVATGPTQIGTQTVRDNYVMPEEFTIAANPRIEDRELAQGSTDLLQEKYEDGLESILVKEDTVCTGLLRRASTMYNSAQYWSGTFTPQVVTALQTELTTWNLPAANVLMAIDLLQDIQNGGSAAWNAVIDPVSRLEILMTGRIGSLFGTDLTTDGFRDPRLRVLANGELFTTTLPTHVGAYTDRGPIAVEPRTNEGNVPGKGWFMSELVSMCVANARGVAYGKRV